MMNESRPAFHSSFSIPHSSFLILSIPVNFFCATQTREASARGSVPGSRACRQLRAGRDRGAVEADGMLGLLAFRFGVVDCVGDLHAARDATEGGEGSVEVRAVADEDEEVRGGAVRLFCSSP